MGGLEHTNRFAASMAKELPQVLVPKTYEEYTSRKVLVSEWIEGEKLAQSTANDVGDLVNLGVICYLKQLLDTGFFHADPHPGNMIRTPDGRLAILDFGLMAEIDNEIKYGMVEAISHLIHRDYEAIVLDFVTLEFIPPGTNLSPILPVLSKVFDQALEGGWSQEHQLPGAGRGSCADYLRLPVQDSSLLCVDHSRHWRPRRDCPGGRPRLCSRGRSLPLPLENAADRHFPKTSRVAQVHDLRKGGGL